MNVSINSVRPRSNSPQSKLDFSTIDTAEEAMLSPGGDLWVGLVLGPLNGHVTVTSGDQVLTYESHLENGKLHYRGNINGEAFTLEGRGVAPEGIRVTGETPGGAVESLRRGGGGGFGLDGKAGTVEFSQLLALDRNGGADGHLAYLGGTVNGLEFHADARKGPDNTVEVRGSLGETPIFQRLRARGRDWIIEGRQGDASYTEIIHRD